MMIDPLRTEVQGAVAVALLGQQKGPVPKMFMDLGFPGIPTQLRLAKSGVLQHEWSGISVGAYRSSVTVRRPGKP